MNAKKGHQKLIWCPLGAKEIEESRGTKQERDEEGRIQRGCGVLVLRVGAT